MARDSKLMLGVTAAVLSTVLVLTAPGQAAAQASPFTQVTSTPFGPVVVVSTCTGDAVTIQGTLRSLIHATFDPAGGGHFRFFTGQNGTGIGTPSGKSYVFSETGGAESNFSGNGSEFTMEMNSRLVTSGPNNNQMLHSTVHVTFNSSGGFTATVDNFRADCQ